MYFGFYPDTQLLWHKGRVTAVVAPSAIYEQVVADFGESEETEWGLMSG